jgi:hypothetical protein
MRPACAVGMSTAVRRRGVQPLCRCALSLMTGCLTCNLENGWQHMATTWVAKGEDSAHYPEFNEGFLVVGFVPAFHSGKWPEW